MPEIALAFLKLGFTAFGGPVAHFGAMHREFVERRRWLGENEFSDLLAASHLMPGPNSTEMVIHVGYARGGLAGLMLAGLGFILPAAFIVGVLAWAYVKFGSLPAAQGALYGVKPVLVAIVAQALFTLLKSSSLPKAPLLAVVAAAMAASLLGLDELLVVFVPGVLAGLWRWNQERRQVSLRPLVGLVLGIGGLVLLASFFGGVGVTGDRPTLQVLFGNFLKVGSVLYGSGYVLLSYLESDFVTRTGWLTRAQLLDAAAVGQFTPGPVFTTATFVGYLTRGAWGAIVATIGIFLPSFLFVAFSGRVIPRLRESIVASAFMKAVTAASLGLMAAVVIQLGQAGIVDFPTLGIGLLTVAALVRFKLNSAWLVTAGALIGIALRS